jgi:hypothetical protein
MGSSAEVLPMVGASDYPAIRPGREAIMDKLIKGAIRLLMLLALIILVVSLAAGFIQEH